VVSEAGNLIIVIGKVVVGFEKGGTDSCFLRMITWR